MPATVHTNFIDRAVKFGEAAVDNEDNKSSDKKKLRNIPAANRIPYVVSSVEEQRDWRNKHRITLHGTSAAEEASALLPYLTPIADLAALKQCHSRLHDAFSGLGFSAPTPIQAQAWPMLLAGKDLIGIASTGSGKTLAFALPGAAHALAQTAPLGRGDGPLCLVLAPTRELAMQIDVECRKLFTALKAAHAAAPTLRSLCVFGGTQRGAQLSSMQASPTFVVATPGRLLDLLNTGTVGLKRVVFAVLDEADRCLDMGFEPQIRNIFEFVRKDRQTSMFSATWPKDVQQLAFDFTAAGPKTVRVQIGSDELHANSAVTQHLQFVKTDADKFPQLRLLLQRFQDQRVLIFVKRRVDADDLERKLKAGGFRKAYAFHGDKEQTERMEVLDRFRKTSTGGILVATDVASRGLDVKELDVVINYDFPMTLEDYVHRIGRTGRAGATGDAFSFITKKEEQLNPWVAQELVDLMLAAKQQVPMELKMWAADTNGRAKPITHAAAAGAYNHNNRLGGGRDMLANQLQYTSSNKPSFLLGGGSGGGSSSSVKWGSGAASSSTTSDNKNSSRTKQSGGGMFGSKSSKESSFNPFA